MQITFCQVKHLFFWAFCLIFKTRLVHFRLRRSCLVFRSFWLSFGCLQNCVMSSVILCFKSFPFQPCVQPGYPPGQKGKSPNPRSHSYGSYGPACSQILKPCPMDSPGNVHVEIVQNCSCEICFWPSDRCSCRIRTLAPGSPPCGTDAEKPQESQFRDV